MDNEKPPVSFPEECLLGRYARPVVYYVAGWTLHSDSKALTAACAKRAKYVSFVQAHNLGKEGATGADLPTSLIDRRKHKSNQGVLYQGIF